ncbi:MAG: AraC family transcriptional regulator [Alphaproteobacteria bacterium]|nr:AraC family transcriptional regulator [Alphaproteobacteria bacterium]
MEHVSNPSVPRLPATSPNTGDPFAETLHLLQLTGTLYCRSELSAPWGIAVPRFDDVMTFMVVMAGSAWLDIDGEEPVLLEPGSLTLLPHGVAHCLRSDLSTPATPLFDLPVEMISERYEILRHGGGGAVTRAMYGVVRLDHVAAFMLISQLPRVLTVNALNDDPGGWLQTTMQFVAREARDMKPGGETVITRLADILIIQAIRSWLETAPSAHGCWLAGLRDEQIGRALVALHRAPERDWSVATLARIAGMSRSSFSDRFTRLVGQPAMQYLTRWRLQTARLHLRETSESLASIAASVGYQSEAAFCRAYKRLLGETPGALRRQEKAKTRHTPSAA